MLLDPFLLWRTPHPLAEPEERIRYFEIGTKLEHHVPGLLTVEASCNQHSLIGINPNAILSGEGKAR